MREDAESLAFGSGGKDRAAEALDLVGLEHGLGEDADENGAEAPAEPALEPAQANHPEPTAGQG